MALTQTFTVIIKGASFFDGEIDGKQTNSGCLHIEDELETRSGRNKGSRTVEYKTLDAGLVKPLVAQPRVSDVCRDHHREGEHEAWHR